MATLAHSQSPPPAHYRADIDGLRAIAVLAVVFFHFDFSWCKGGFVGVDIFFVISGYLITSIITKSVQKNTFTFSHFYSRRFKRILPALTAVVIASALCGAIILHPGTLMDLARSISANSLFLSNFYFFSESGYFDEPSLLKPLLHTWSLAVEEQFYIIMPVLIVLISKLRKKPLLPILLILCILSFALNIYFVNTAPEFTFFLLPTRAWELLIGSILAVSLNTPIKSERLKFGIALVGLTSITLSIFLINPSTAFPGYAALFPTLGTAMIIQSGKHGGSYIHTLLSTKIMVFIGLISYSLYLWHWPILIFSKIYAITEMQSIHKLGALLLIFLISILSYRFIEKPFRHSNKFTDKHTITFSIATLLMTCLAGHFILQKNGFPDRIKGLGTNASITNEAQWVHWGQCENALKPFRTQDDLCILGAQNQKPSFIVWGDSHARAMATAIDISARHHNLSGYVISRNACPPLFNIEKPGRNNCHELNQVVKKIILNNTDSLQAIVMVARWPHYIHEMELEAVFQNENVVPANDNITTFKAGLDSTIRFLNGQKKSIIIVNAVPEIWHHVPTLNLSAYLTGRDINQLIGLPTSSHKERLKTTNSIFNTYSSLKQITMVQPSVLLCDTSRCNVAIDYNPLYRDSDHLSTYGAEFVSPLFDPVFAEFSQNKTNIRNQH